MTTPYTSLFYFGNESLNNKFITLLEVSHPTSSAISLQSINNPRIAGATVVNTQKQAKNIVVNGGIQTMDDSNLTIEDLHTRVRRIFNTEDSRWFRVVPEWYYISDDQNSTNWTTGGDFNTKGLNTYNVQNQDDQSLSCNLTVSTGSGTLTYSGDSKNLTSYLVAGNSICFGVYLPDSYGITGIEYQVGSDSSNYYSTGALSVNYEGLGLANGWNCFAVRFEDLTQTGTVDKANIDWQKIILTCSTTEAENQTGILLSRAYIATESRVRNYPCYREGEVDMPEVWGANETQIRFKATLFNYLGYGVSTFEEVLFTETNITTLSQTKKITLEGDYPPLPRHNLGLTDTTNLTDLRLTNLANNEQIQFTNTWVDGDILAIDNGALTKASVLRNGGPQDFNGKLPEVGIGTQRFRLDIVQGSNEVINNETGSSYQIANWSAQSFVPSISGTLTFASINYKFYEDVFGILSTTQLLSFMSIYSDSGGSPNTALYTAFASRSPGYVDGVHTITPDLSVTASTTYWLVLQSQQQPESYGIFPYGSTTSTYSGGSAKVSTNGTSWSAGVLADLSFSVSISPTPTTDINWSVSYRKLYS
jgi:hypothetical protein